MPSQEMNKKSWGVTSKVVKAGMAMTWEGCQRWGEGRKEGRRRGEEGEGKEKGGVKRGREGRREKGEGRRGG
jgi:hypothetical protein